MVAATTVYGNHKTESLIQAIRNNDVKKMQLIIKTLVSQATRIKEIQKG